jgi:hypothetical protein
MIFLIFSSMACKAHAEVKEVKVAETRPIDPMPDFSTNCVDYDWGGPFYRFSSDEQVAWQNGFALYFNAVDGRNFQPPQTNLNADQAYFCMVLFHSERCQNWLENFSIASGYPWPPANAGWLMVTSALRYNMDYRHAPAAAICENWECFGLTGHDPYGMRFNGSSFAEATNYFFYNLLTTSGYAPWTPEQVSGNYNLWKPVYMENWCSIFWSIR